MQHDNDEVMNLKTQEPRTTASMDRLLNECIKPHADALARIALDRSFAVLVFEADTPGIEAAAVLGSNGRACFGVTRERMMQTIGKTDHASERWASRPSNAHRLGILLIVQSGSLLVNYEGHVFSVEPGSTDAGVMN
jgi:hypothetical protein